MKAIFITLVISSLWGFASFTPLALAHNVHLLWVFSTVLAGGIFWSLIAVHMVDLFMLWKLDQLVLLRQVHRNIWADLATFISSVFLLILIKKIYSTLPVVYIHPVAWLSMALLLCAVRIAFFLVFRVSNRKSCKSAIVAFSFCAATLWYVCFTAIQVAMGGLNSSESVWFYITMAAAAISTYWGIKQISCIRRNKNLRTAPFSALIKNEFDIFFSYPPKNVTAERKVRNRRCTNKGRKNRRNHI
ncbi:hypothetical protein [Xanthomonas arboricola]|uniref:hypothetical protein n=1 Tax=Xanthomonas arboricola TaxID=56448 RepID=UPI003EC1457B